MKLISTKEYSSGFYFTISRKIPLANYVLPQPELPINRTDCYTEMKDFTSSEVARVSLVGTVILDIIIPYMGSKSIWISFLAHSSNFTDSEDWSTK